MSTDRELLEAAAKVAGLEIVGPVEAYIAHPSYEHIGGFIVRNDKGGDSAWNPLACDGDAFRLAVKLRLNISFTRGLGSGHKAEYMQVVPNALGHLAEFGPIGDEPCETIRHAIVRAAAELGKS